jgi:hypothetical protein
MKSPRLFHGIRIVAALLVFLAACDRSATTGGPEDAGQTDEVKTAASCAQPYSEEALFNQEFAFDGTVLSLSSRPEESGSYRTADFQVNEWYKGPYEQQTISLKVPSVGQRSIDFPRIEVGERFLVSGAGGFAHPCRFTQSWSAPGAAEWEEIFLTS